MNLSRKISRLIPDFLFIRLQYYKNFKRFPNLKNPKTFNEKIQWKKLYDRKAFYTKLADKLEAREYVKQKIGEEHLIPLYDVIRTPEDFNPEKYPNSFVAKANHASGLNLLVKDKGNINPKSVKETFSEWLKTDFYKKSREWQYKDIPRAIVVEEFLMDQSGNPPEDYKFHCFNGKVEFIQVDMDRFSDQRRNFYNTDWDLQPFLFSPIDNGKSRFENGENVARPQNFNKMLHVAERLSEDFNYIRVDLYSFQQKILFGELTFHHGNGNEQFIPSKFDLIFGEKLSL